MNVSSAVSRRVLLGFQDLGSLAVRPSREISYGLSKSWGVPGGERTKCESVQLSSLQPPRFSALGQLVMQPSLCTTLQAIFIDLSGGELCSLVKLLRSFA